MAMPQVMKALGPKGGQQFNELQGRLPLSLAMELLTMWQASDPRRFKSLSLQNLIVPILEQQTLLLEKAADLQADPAQGHLVLHEILQISGLPLTLREVLGQIPVPDKEEGMAFSTKIFCYPTGAANPSIDLDLSWWNSRELMEDPRFTPCGQNSSYNDYEAYLGLPDVVELHEKYRAQAIKVYRSGYSFETLFSKIKVLEGVLYLNTSVYSRFRVLVYEWESGY